MVAATETLTDDVLIERHIDTVTDDRGPAYARLAEYGTPVWALIGYLQAVEDETRVAADYELPLEAVQAALAYYRRRKAHIDAFLLLNDAAAGDE